MYRPFSYLTSLGKQLCDLLPSVCAVCRNWPAQPVCAQCVASLTSMLPRCRSCALVLPDCANGTLSQCGACLRQSPALDACWAALAYEPPWSTLIARYKFNQHPGWAGVFAQLLRQTLGVQETLLASDWIVPMPLSATRLQERGFNQAWELVKALAQPDALQRRKIHAQLLLRIKDTPPQRLLHRKERLANVKGAFAVDPMRAHQLQGARVVLVDDVMTSGASVFTAAQVLRQAGAAQVSAVVLARTGT